LERSNSLKNPNEAQLVFDDALLAAEGEHARAANA